MKKKGGSGRRRRIKEKGNGSSSIYEKLMIPSVCLNMFGIIFIIYNFDLNHLALLVVPSFTHISHCYAASITKLRQNESKESKLSGRKKKQLRNLLYLLFAPVFYIIYYLSCL